MSKLVSSSDTSFADQISARCNDALMDQIDGHASVDFQWKFVVVDVAPSFPSS